MSKLHRADHPHKSLERSGSLLRGVRNPQCVHLSGLRRYFTRSPNLGQLNNARAKIIMDKTECRNNESWLDEDVPAKIATWICGLGHGAIGRVAVRARRSTIDGNIADRVWLYRNGGTEECYE